MQRKAAFARIADQSAPFDFIVIGGGASGLGVAVDAASRGHSVALFERGDFAGCTSSRSTKLVHGGVRYLRQGNIALVLEALRERGLLARNAPHLVRDLAFVIPSYKWWDGPFYGIGMKVYDTLAGRLGLAPSRMLSREETIGRLPTIETAGLTGGVCYHDGQFDDSRLAVNLAQTATELGAAVVNYCQVTGLLREAGMLCGVRVRDEESGVELEVRGRAIINATGVFADQLRQLDDPGAPPLLAVSQGVHLVLPKRFLPGEAAIMVPRTSDGRVLFAVPWHDRVVLGTTDTPRQGPEREPRALDHERAYLLEHARRYLAMDPVESDVLSVFAGLRPLVRTGSGADTAALSRDHSIHVSESGLLTLSGGKWTTYRKMAEDLVDHAELVAGVTGRKCITEDLRLHGWCQPAAQPETVLAPYGADAQALQALLREHPELAAPLHPALPYQQVQIVWAARQEMARTVEDCLARRTRALLLDARAAIEAGPLVAHLLARELGRDEAWCRTQTEDFVTLARGYVFTDPASRVSGTEDAR